MAVPRTDLTTAESHPLAGSGTHTLVPAEKVASSVLRRSVDGDDIVQLASLVVFVCAATVARRSTDALAIETCGNGRGTTAIPPP